MVPKSIYGRKLMNPEVRVEFRHLYDSVMSDYIHTRLYAFVIFNPLTEARIEIEKLRYWIIVETIII